MSWTAIVPIKSPHERKSRLASRLSQQNRVQLSEFMLQHVLGVLQQTAKISAIAVLSPERPNGWNGRWIVDGGCGLNAELQTASALFGQRVIVVHADLPALTATDLSALIAAADLGVAIAPDRHRGGTNALAVQDPSAFRFCFGAGSFAQHRAIAGTRGTTVWRDGLALDVDLPEDLTIAVELGIFADGQNGDSTGSSHRGAAPERVGASAATLIVQRAARP